MTSPAPSPEVSILIPVYNTAATLPRAVESLRRQSMENIEIIIINDASPDNAAEVIASLTARDDRIRTVTLEKNCGTFAARIAGLSYCRGRFVMNLDADDTLDSDAVSTLLQTADRHGADAVGFGARELAPDGSVMRNFNTLDSTPFILENGDIFDALFRSHSFSWSLCLKMIRRDVMCDAIADSGIDPEMYVVFADDFLQFVPIAVRLKKFVMSGKIFYNYFQDIGITGSKQLSPAAFERAASMLDALTAAKDFLKRSGIFDRYSAAFALREKEQLQMLADRFRSQTSPEDREEIFASLCRRYSREKLEEIFFAAPAGDTGNRSAANKLAGVLKTESFLWYLLKKLQGRIKFRKGKVFHDC